ncbi:hypothetical protein [Actinomadura bangladeshensis]|uniref:Uncharacterized protein n=1 Tax=Actinomadura bangladeshensis TaxID=453573 RepID=A0A4R4N5M2_9ACTN|nr:hypothetical protein [Actinomadura bangladeshensis]TDC02370.1 hypothetical protein E1284_39480 [Actinomadura bangladeshensis]
MTGDRRAAVVRISPARQSMTRKKAVGLTEEERQLLLAELAEITAELDELHARTQQITARVHGAESTCPARESGAA